MSVYFWLRNCANPASGRGPSPLPSILDSFLASDCLPLAADAGASLLLRGQSQLRRQSVGAALNDTALQCSYESPSGTLLPTYTSDVALTLPLCAHRDALAAPSLPLSAAHLLSPVKAAASKSPPNKGRTPSLARSPPRVRHGRRRSSPVTAVGRPSDGRRSAVCRWKGCGCGIVTRQQKGAGGARKQSRPGRRKE